MKAILVLTFILVSLVSNVSMACEGKNLKAGKKEKTDIEKLVEEKKQEQSKNLPASETKKVNK